MIVVWDEKDYEFDIDDLDVKQASYIQNHFGLTPMTMRSALVEMDPKAIVATYWLLMKQNGVTIDPNKVNFKVVKFWSALMEAFNAEQQATDPTEETTEAETPGTSGE